MKKEEIDQYRKNLLLEHEHFLRMLYMAIVKSGSWDEAMRQYSLSLGSFILIATDTRRVKVHAGNTDNTPFIDVSWDYEWNIERKGSYIVPGKWIYKVRKFVDDTLAEENAISDNLISKMLQDHPDIEKIELEV